MFHAEFFSALLRYNWQVELPDGSGHCDRYLHTCIMKGLPFSYLTHPTPHMIILLFLFCLFLFLLGRVNHLQFKMATQRKQNFGRVQVLLKTSWYCPQVPSKRKTLRRIDSGKPASVKQHGSFWLSISLLCPHRKARLLQGSNTVQGQNTSFCFTVPGSRKTGVLVRFCALSRFWGPAGYCVQFQNKTTRKESNNQPGSSPETTLERLSTW